MNTGNKLRSSISSNVQSMVMRSATKCILMFDGVLFVCVSCDHFLFQGSRGKSFEAVVRRYISVFVGVDHHFVTD